MFHWLQARVFGILFAFFHYHFRRMDTVLLSANRCPMPLTDCFELQSAVLVRLRLVFRTREEDNTYI